MLISTQTKYQITVFLIVRCRILLGFLVVGLLGSCGSTRIGKTAKSFQKELGQPKDAAHFMGILVYDPETKDTLFAKDHHRYFTPASNVKIFTLYTALHLLPDGLPALRYQNSGGVLQIIGTGDPTLLHPEFETKDVIALLQSADTVQVYLENYKGNPFMPGWAWEDYDAYFSPEVGPLPLYGNAVEIRPTEPLTIVPDYFRPLVARGTSKFRRARHHNRFFVSPELRDTLRIPFITSSELTLQLLQEKVSVPVVTNDIPPSSPLDTLWGNPTDSVVHRMLLKSDNFLAEQLALTTSSQLGDTLDFTRLRTHMLNGPLSDLKHKPRWVDGSGLSRYNLFTPTSMVQVLEKLWIEFDRRRVLTLMPTWDHEGTKPKSDQDDFIWAKSGYVGNNYNLSGYIKTKSGKVLLFSFMNNHYLEPTASIRDRMYRCLQLLHQSY